MKHCVDRKDGGGGTQGAILGAAARVATPLGLVPAHQLRPGDAVLSAHGPPRRVTRLLQCHATAIRIAANALAEGAPARDLMVEAGQALALGDVCAPVRLLANGASITCLDAPQDCLRLELNGPAVMLAERVALSCGAMETRVGGLGVLRSATDARAGLVPGELLGVLGRVSPLGVTGWAHDRGNPAVPVLLEILVDGEHLATLLAERERPDLLNVAGDIRRGLELRFPAPLDASRPHLVTLRRASDGMDLRGSPALVPAAVALPALLDRMPASTRQERIESAAILREQIARLRAAGS
jgi:hypothetical protein